MRSQKKISSAAAEAPTAISAEAATSIAFQTMADAMSSATMPVQCIAQMPTPIASAPPARQRQVSEPRLATNKATADTATPATYETTVSARV